MFRTKQFHRWTMAMVVLAACAGWVKADDAKLPSADEVFDRFVQVTGGEANYKKQNTRVIEGTVEMMGMGIKMTMKVTQARPDRFRAIFNSDAFGKIDQGSVDGMVWDVNAMMGASLKEGKEKSQRLREAKFDSTLNWKESFPERKTVGIEEVDGAKCYKLELKNAEGNSETHYYAVDTGLLNRSTATQITPQGEVPVTTDYSDYREVDGVKSAFKVKATVMGMVQVVAFDKIESNVELPPDAFEPPDEIKDLLKAEAAEGKDKQADGKQS